MQVSILSGCTTDTESQAPAWSPAALSPPQGSPPTRYSPTWSCSGASSLTMTLTIRWRQSAEKPSGLARPAGRLARRRRPAFLFTYRRTTRDTRRSTGVLSSRGAVRHVAPAPRPCSSSGSSSGSRSTSSPLSSTLRRLEYNVAVRNWSWSQNLQN